MAILILSDIHSNYQALQAVVADAHLRSRVDGVWCLGDTVGYGPDPGPCIRLLRDQRAVAVAGNHDLGSIGRVPLDEFNHYATVACQWNGAQLTSEEAVYLGALPITLQEGGFTLVHGSPRDPIWEYLTSEEEAEASFPLFDTPWCLVGHTHIPLGFLWKEDGKGAGAATGFSLPPGQPLALGGLRLIYNPGGVGQPRDGDPRAAYALYDPSAQTLTHHRVAYDIPATQARMAACGLPEYLIRRLERGR